MRGFLQYYTELLGFLLLGFWMPEAMLPTHHGLAATFHTSCCILCDLLQLDHGVLQAVPSACGRHCAHAAADSFAINLSASPLAVN